MAHEAHKAVTSGRVTGPEIFLRFLIQKLFLVRTDNTTVVAYIINIQGRLHSWHIAAPRLISWSNSLISESHSCIGHIGPGNWMDFYPTLTGN